MVQMELQYLYENDRVSEPPLPVLDTLESHLGLTICHAPFPAIIKESESQNWTRDPFDRIIVAQAALYGAILITKDEFIRKHYPNAFWE
jgi:PIN domain nuclease of toxin-antitoxin system